MRKVRDFHSQSWSNPFARREGPGLWRQAGGILLVMAVAAGLGYGFVYSPILRIGRIDIEGAKPADEARLRAAAAQSLAGYEYSLWPNDFLLTANSAGVRNRLLLQFPNLRSAEVAKGFDRLLIRVEEKTATYRLLVGDKAYLLDQDGNGIKEAATGEGDSLIAVAQDNAVFAVDKPMIQQTWLTPISDLHKYFATQVGVRDRLLKLNPEDRTITVESTEGWNAIVDPAASIQTQLESLSSALLGKFNPSDRQKLSYIDVRFGDKIFYKWK